MSRTPPLGRGVAPFGTLLATEYGKPVAVVADTGADLKTLPPVIIDAGWWQSLFEDGVNERGTHQRRARQAAGARECDAGGN
jgi:hypothetical protein